MYTTLCIIIIVSGVSITTACTPLEASDIVDIRRTVNKRCGSECAAVWNTTATAGDCQLWTEKAWWSGSGCVVKCDDLKGYKTTVIKDSIGVITDSYCTSTDSIQNTTLNYYNGELPPQPGLNSIPMWCACYDLFRYVRYSDRGFCYDGSRYLTIFQIIFIVMGAIGILCIIIDTMCPCCCARTDNQGYPVYDLPSEPDNHTTLFLFIICAVLIIFSPFALYISIAVIAAIAIVFLIWLIRYVLGMD
jgi:hypothetical protein